MTALRHVILPTAIPAFYFFAISTVLQITIDRDIKDTETESEVTGNGMRCIDLFIDFLIKLEEKRGKNNE